MPENVYALFSFYLYMLYVKTFTERGGKKRTVKAKQCWEGGRSTLKAAEYPQK